MLRDRSPAEADSVLDALIAHARPSAPGSAASAEPLALAAGAEALALKGQWDEAARMYRLSIDHMTDPMIRRSWWMNLAELYLRLNDESRRQEALESAKGADANDDINRRAVDLLKFYGGRNGRGALDKLSK